MRLSMYVHRVTPSYSDVGIRLKRGIDWLSFKPIPREIIKFMDYLIIVAETCSSLSLNIIRSSSVKFKKYLNKNRINALAKIHQELGNIKMHYNILEIIG